MKERQLQTERLNLDVLQVQDHDFIQQLLNTEGWLRFIGDRHIHSTGEAIAYINKIINTPHLTYWVARDKVTKMPVGIISFLKREYLEHFDIGFAFLPQACGKGFAFEAANRILSEADKDPQHAIVLATTVPENAASIGLLCKLGFSFQEEIVPNGLKLHVYYKKVTDKLPVTFQ
jgi:RimJ/RimL family protein N-acetyltransferase